MRNSATHSHNLRNQSHQKIENEIDLWSNSISKKSRLHYQTDNKYLNLRRLNSNRIEKLNSILNCSNRHDSFKCNQNNNANASCVSPIFIDDDDDSQTKLFSEKMLKSEFLSKFNLIEVNNSNKKEVQQKKFNLRSHNFDKNGSNMAKNEQKHIQYDVSAPLTDQYLENPIRHTQNIGEQSSKIDLELLPNSQPNDSFTPISTKNVQQEPMCKIANEKLSAIEYLTKLSASSVPKEAFQHVLLNLKHSKQIVPQKIEDFNYKSINFCKLEFIYEENFYWIVKIKKILALTRPKSVLYQMKFVRTVPNNSHSLSSLNLNETESNTNINNNLSNQMSEPNSLNNSFFNDSISVNTQPNFNWLFSTDSSSRLSKCLISCFRPLGWSKKNDRVLKKPIFLDKNSNENSYNDLCYLLHYLNVLDSDMRCKNEGLIVFSSDEIESQSSLLNFNNFLNCFEENSYCEFYADDEASSVRIVKILRNVAGRLLIEIDKDLSIRKWLFYTDRRLKPLSYSKQNDFKYSNSIDKDLIIDSVFDLTLKNVSNSNQFKVGYCLECLYENKFYAARVIEAVSNRYFKIKLENSRSTVLTFYYNDLISDGFFSKENFMNEEDDGCLEFVFSNSFHTLFPCKWCSSNKLRLELPENYPKNENEFDWDFYLERVADKQQCYLTKLGADSHLFNWSKHLNQLSEQFELGMYMECVTQSNSDLILLGQIRAKLNHLLFVKIINREEENAPESKFPLHVYTIDSSEIFPVGWCEMNNFYSSIGLKHDECYILPRLKCELNSADSNPRKSPLTQLENIKSLRGTKYWCDGIQLNTNCNNGPFLIKSKLERLPKVFGPGPLVLIMHKLLQFLINASEKPLKLLKLLQASKKNVHSSSNSFSNLELDRSAFVQRSRLKAKEKGKYFFKEVELCKDTNQLNEYLILLCAKLKCCYKMLSIDKNQNLDLGQTKNESRPDCQISNDRLTSDIKCCALCTLNYFSNSNNSHSDSLNLNSVKNSNSFAKPASSVAAPKQKAEKTNANTTKTDRNSRLKDDPNFSPIKTRSNLRLLESMKSSADQHDFSLCKDNISKGEFEKSNKVSKRTQQRSMTNVTSANNSSTVASLEEPSVKKAKRFTKSVSVIDTRLKSEETSPNRPRNHARSSPSPADAHHSRIQEKSPHADQNSFISGAHLTNKKSPTSCNTSNHNSSNLILSNQTNPVHWSIDDVCKYLIDNRFDPNLVHSIRENEIDGQSFLMLNLPTIQNYMNMKLGPAIKLAHLVERLKQFYFQQFNNAENGC